MDENTQMDIARRFVEALRDRDVDVVLVGSTAIVARGLFHKTSKDVDALSEPGLSLDEAREILEEIAEDQSGELVETGWDTLRVQEDSEPSSGEPWKADLIVPGERSGTGIIPPEAANRIRSRAEETDIAPAAISEHIVVMKAVAFGDCHSKGQNSRAQEYKGDVMEFRDRDSDLDWGEVEELLGCFPDARAGLAVELLNEIFGVGLPEPDRRGVL